MPGFSCQQGDIFIWAIRSPHRAKLGDPLPRDEQRRIVLGGRRGSGHAHAIADLDAEAFHLRDWRYGLILKVGRKGAMLVHEEHAPIRLPPGTYDVRRQCEFSARFRSVPSGD